MASQAPIFTSLSRSTCRGCGVAPLQRLMRGEPIEEYLASRYILNPLRLWDCDRPVNASTAYWFTTADRARDMRQNPVDVLNHAQHRFKQRSTQADLDEIEDWTDRSAKRL